MAAETAKAISSSLAWQMAIIEKWLVERGVPFLYGTYQERETAGGVAYAV